MMDTQARPDACAEAPDTTSAEALRMIIEVFLDAGRAAADLRQQSCGLSPGELETEIGALEHGMLTEITRICSEYELKTLQHQRH